MPSEKLKTMQRVNFINFTLYFLECSCILAFAFVLKHYYHNQLYCKFFSDLPQVLGLSALYTFEHLLLMMFVVVVIVTVSSILLLLLYSRVLHPRTKLFTKRPEQ